MKTAFRKSFVRDLKKIKDRPVLEQVKQAIEQIEAVASIQEASNVKKLSGTVSFYRIRVGEYRLGVVVDKTEVEFVRCLHRREIYRYFP